MLRRWCGSGGICAEPTRPRVEPAMPNARRRKLKRSTVRDRGCRTGKRHPADRRLLIGIIGGGLLFLFASQMVAEPGLFSGLSSAAIDRKSTRLNSSHLVISYAVFC